MPNDFNDVAQIIFAALVGIAAVMNAFARILTAKRPLTPPEPSRQVIEPQHDSNPVAALLARLRNKRRG